MEKKKILHEDLTELTDNQLIQENQYLSEHLAKTYWKLIYVLRQIDQAPISVFRLQHDFSAAIDRKHAIMEEIIFRNI